MISSFFPLNYRVGFSMLVAIFLFGTAIGQQHSPAGITVAGASLHSSYDEATLGGTPQRLLMPDNRFLDPAGEQIRFGDGGLENHSLDCALLPGGKTLVVEDRYGLAFINPVQHSVIDRLSYNSANPTRQLMSTYSGVITQVDGQGETHIFWSAASSRSPLSYVLEASWNGSQATLIHRIPFAPLAPARSALPNGLAIQKQNDGETYLYVILNGNNQLAKIRLKDYRVIWQVPTGMVPYGLVLDGSKAFVTNWAGPVPTDSSRDQAGVPWGEVEVDPRTGATLEGTVSVISLEDGHLIREIRTGLHPNAVVISPDHRLVYVANGNSDDISVIRTASNRLVGVIGVKMDPAFAGLIGDSPNAMAIDSHGKILYVANGLDNAVAVVKLTPYLGGKQGWGHVEGFIPTGAYPGGIALGKENLYVTNLEGEGPRVARDKAFNTHHMLATLSCIPLPVSQKLKRYTLRANKADLLFRIALTNRLPRKGMAPVPVPARIGEPSVFRHVVYIIKENRTYDQVLGDLPQGDGQASLTAFGEQVTPNEHQMARDFLLLDNYYASGKCSAEGHQWADAAMVTDYVEKNVRAWFRSYPHVQNDAMVYDPKGFIWNDALRQGRSVRIYGEAATPHYQQGLDWKAIYQLYLDHQPFHFYNTSTIAPVRPLLCPLYPGYDGHKINDQIRASGFITDLKRYEQMPGDQWPNLLVLALPSDHTAGTRPGYPTPRAMVADNDLALGRIVEAISHSRFWDSTVIFVSEDDSQDGWDHVSAFRTTGFVISPYSRLRRRVHTNYNQTCMVRTMEQILGLKPMNILDATALPMFNCFQAQPDFRGYQALAARIPLDEMNPSIASLKGKAKQMAIYSCEPQFDHIDGGNDQMLNRIIWSATMGEKPYPDQGIMNKNAKESAATLDSGQFP
ncbi:MAG: bifunctional YncE family protein/alkaline phosphatase family protein [Chitinophagaceae bacterium]